MTRRSPFRQALRTSIERRTGALWLGTSVTLAGGGVVLARSEALAYARLAGAIISFTGLLIAVLAGPRTRYRGLYGCAPGCAGALTGALLLGFLAFVEDRRKRGPLFEYGFSLDVFGVLVGGVLGAIVAFILTEARIAPDSNRTAETQVNPPTT